MRRPQRMVRKQETKNKRTKKTEKEEKIKPEVKMMVARFEGVV
jgi:hypothetical protein